MTEKVAVLDDYHGVFDRDPSIERLRERVPVDVFTAKLASLERLAPYPILIALRERTRFDAAFFERLPGLELIAQTGNHAYHVDVAAATRAGVLIGMASSDTQSMAAVARSTIELSFGLMLAVLRRIPQTDQAMRSGQWPSFAGRTLYGKKLGVLGLGRIGREIALLAQAFGMQVLAWGPTLTPERAAKSGAAFMELDALLGAADVVSVHLKLSDESRGLLDERRLRMMKPDAVLVNTARGGLVDEGVLAALLRDGKLGGAALDVFDNEPLPAGSALAGAPRLILTPHIAGVTLESNERVSSLIAQKVAAALERG